MNQNFNKDFLNCVKAFNGSFKYYELLLNEINKNKKEEKESDDKYRKRILKSFYNLMYNKIKNNIERSFSEQDKIYFIQNLVDIREMISKGTNFDYLVYKYLLEYCPIKYLDINLDYSGKMTSSYGLRFGNYSYYFDYSNHFAKFALNKIIEEYYLDKNNNDESEYEINFDKEVSNQLSKLIYHSKKITKRNIWTLIGVTKNTKSYVEKIRKKENCELYEFFNKKYANIFIDGIDEEKVIFNIKDEDVFLHQVSKTKKGFDSGLLIKKDKTSNDKTHDLILFKNKKYKMCDIETKEIYIEVSIKSKNYLESLYQGLKIDKIYFIFIVPDTNSNHDKKILILKCLHIYYIYFSLQEGKFLDKNRINDVSDFRIKDSEITFSKINYLFNKAISDIDDSKRIFESSKKKFFKRKKSGKQLIEIYEKLSELNLHECIQVEIPTKLKKNIIDIFISENYFEKGTHINFLPSANYNELKIEELFKKTHNLIIFSFNNNMFFYFYSYYKINDDYNIEKINNIDFGDNKNIVIPKTNLKDFKEIKNYSLFLFCYNVLENYSSNLKAK